MKYCLRFTGLNFIVVVSSAFFSSSTQISMVPRCEIVQRYSLTVLSTIPITLTSECFLSSYTRNTRSPPSHKITTLSTGKSLTVPLPKSMIQLFPACRVDDALKDILHSFPHTNGELAADAFTSSGSSIGNIPPEWENTLKSCSSSSSSSDPSSRAPSSCPSGLFLTSLFVLLRNLIALSSAACSTLRPFCFCSTVPNKSVKKDARRSSPLKLPNTACCNALSVRSASSSIL
mmetsp:Transcript_119828/g.187948  ORF Transcript_119828/g.187948 Transcript_119828/m.187948 type:complete len:232 (-) Transcript_119828:1224-1919(-)